MFKLHSTWVIQLRLAVVYIMKGKPYDFLAWFGIKCSTWVGINAATSLRAACASLGDLSKRSVLEGNAMLERTLGEFVGMVHDTYQ